MLFCTDLHSKNYELIKENSLKENKFRR